MSPIAHTELFKNILRNTVSETFPKQSRGRPAKITFDIAYDGIRKVVRTGMPWRCLTSESVSFVTIFKTLHRWSEEHVFERAYKRLLRLYKRTPRHYAIDSTYVKNQYGRDVVGRNPTDRGRKATKFSVVVDDQGMPFSFLFTGANESDMRLFDRTLGCALQTLVPETPMYADKGYDSRANRHCAESYGLRDRLFKRRSSNTRRTHARRGVVERFFAWHDKQRRLVQRYEQKIHIYASMTFLFAGGLLEKRVRIESSEHHVLQHQQSMT